MQPTLENISLWYEYKSRVWSEESPETAVVHNIMRVLRATRNSDFAYISTPITSGIKLYKRMRGHTNPEALKESVIAENYAAGWNFLEDVNKRTSLPIVFPADLTPVHQNWEQAHFMALWLSIIAEKCSEVHMNEDWEYSNGCVEEFTHTMQLRLGLPKHEGLLFYNTKESEDFERERMKGIRVYDHSGNDLSLKNGLAAINNARRHVRDLGFPRTVLLRCSTKLNQVAEMQKAGFYQ